MSFKDWLVQLLASRWVMPDPRVAEARRQQQAVAGDRWSVKVDPRAFESWSGWTRGRRGT